MAEESSARICPRCGKPIPATSRDCPQCEHRFKTFLHSRETVLTASALIVLILFVITGAVARSYHEKLHALAGQWFAAAEKDLEAGNAQRALSDLRNALVYEPEDPRIQFRLAQALVADNRDEEARSYLEGLLARSPSDAEVNLALGRIAANTDDERDALRYYHGAIYGVWPENPRENRLSARLELSKYLVARNDYADAAGELIALQSEIPEKNGEALREQTAELFLRAGDARRALGEFKLALRPPQAPATAWKGAGMAAYNLGEFAAARRYLTRAHRMLKDDDQVSATLETVTLALAWNPYMRGLTEEQKRERTRHDFEQAMSRLENCAKSSGVDLSAQTATTGEANLSALYAQAQNLQPRLAEKNLRRHPEQADAAMNLVFAIEAATAEKCGEPTGLDEALLELQKFEPGGEQ